MKSSLIALATAALVLLPSSAAQQKGVWTHPSGTYQLNYGDVGWKIGASFSYKGKSALVTFEPQSWDRLQGSCLIFEGRLNLPEGVDQARANEMISGYTAEMWAPPLGFDPARVRYFQNEMVGEVRVATMVVDSTKPLLRSHYRSFIIIKSNGAFQQELSCSISPNASTRHKKDLAQFLGSLRFEPRVGGQ